LLVGALARGDIAVDFDGTSYEFLERPPFLAAVLAIAVLLYVLERRRSEPVAGDLALGALGAGLGALLFAGSLAAGRYDSRPGLVAGAACAAIAYLAVSRLLKRVRRRLDSDAAPFLTLYAEALALILAALAIVFPPVAFLALAAFGWLLVAAPAGERGKYAGLRILR